MSDLKDWLKLKVEIQRRTNCWRFTGARDHSGYGRVFLDGKEWKAPRAYYEAFVAPIPAGAKLVHHLDPKRCIGAACCNPAHVRVTKPRKLTSELKICPRGHVIDADNAVVDTDGARLKIRCRICRNREFRGDV